MEFYSRRFTFYNRKTLLPPPLLEISAHSDRQHGLEFDCNQEVSLVRGARPAIDFKLHLMMFSRSVFFPVGNCVAKIIPTIVAPELLLLK